LHFLGHMGQWSLTRLFGDLITKSLGCPLILATNAICFRERFPTRPTTKSSFVQDEIDLISSKLDISFHTLAAIMDLATLLSTSGASCAPASRSHLYLNAFICSQALAHYLEFGQIQRYDDPLVWLALSCPLPFYGILLWHRVSFVRLGFFFLLLPTKDTLIAPFPPPFSYPLPAFTLLDRDPLGDPISHLKEAKTRIVAKSGGKNLPRAGWESSQRRLMAQRSIISIFRGKSADELLSGRFWPRFTN
jgi:hypothetical protein